MGRASDKRHGSEGEGGRVKSNGPGGVLWGPVTSMQKPEGADRGFGQQDGIRPGMEEKGVRMEVGYLGGRDRRQSQPMVCGGLIGGMSRTGKNFIFRVFPLLPLSTQHNCSQECSTEGLGDVATRGGLSIYASGFGFPELQQEGIWRFSSVYSCLSDCCEDPAFSILRPHPETWNTRIQPCVTGCRAQWLSLLEAGRTRSVR